MFNLRQMEVFYAVMRTGSITEAARMLDVTQPVVSGVLKHCESRMKVKLFVQVAGRLQPTPEAHAIFPKVAALFGRLHALGRSIQDVAGGRLGSLSIAAVNPLANGFVARAVGSFMAARTDTRIALQSLTSRQVIGRVANREVDIGIAFEPVPHAELTAEVLTTVDISCVMRTDCEFTAFPDLSLDQIADSPILTYRPISNLRPPVDRAFEQAGIVPRISVQFGLSITGMMLVHFGAGIALVEPSLLETLGLHDLTSRPLRPRIALNVYLVRHPAAAVTPACEEFIFHLKDSIGRPTDKVRPQLAMTGRS